MTPSRLTLGTAQLGTAYGIANRVGRLTGRQVEALLTAALDLGIRSFDTAAAYGDAEERLGAFFAVHGWPADARVVSKLPPLSRDDDRDLEAAVAAALRRSLRSLGRGRIDDYLVHRAEDLARHGDALVRALSRHVEAGEVGRIGISGYGPEDAASMMRWPALRAIQLPLNLLDRRIAEGGVLARLAAAGITTFARSAFLQGLFAFAPAELPPAMRHAAAPLQTLRAVLSDHGLTPMEAALPFVATLPVDQIVIGVDTPEQLRANVAALATPIPPDLSAALAAALGALDESVINPARWPQASSPSALGARGVAARTG